MHIRIEFLPGSQFRNKKSGATRLSADRIKVCIQVISHAESPNKL